VERAGYFVPPKGKTRLHQGDLLFVVGTPEAADQLPKLCGHPARRVRSAMVLGGGRVGYQLAATLLEAGVHVKLAESDLDRCRIIAEQLPKADVLHGDCTDQELLIEERINHIDVFIACTQDDEVNILTALLAKKLGAKAALVRENTAHYTSLIDSVDVDAAVSVRQAAVGSILRFARRGDVLAAVPFGHTEGEVTEVRAHATSALVSAPISKLRLPKDLVIGAVVRGEELLVATGDLQIQPDDRVVIFAPQRRSDQVQKLVTVGLGFF
jgi:trk system potassium uptake protein TrkA